MANNFALKIYALAGFVALPVLAISLVDRAIMRPPYRRFWAERFGFASIHSTTLTRRPVWIHAVSVGETRAAQPLINALLADSPDRVILLTHMTPTGRATGEALYAKQLANGRLVQAYLPYDYAFAMRRFIKRWQPTLAVMMETEVWPNLITVANTAGLPIALVNARLSEKSLQKGLRFKALITGAVQGFNAIAAQSQADAERIRQFKPNVPVHVLGSTKFDVPIPEHAVALGKQWKKSLNRPTLVFASSRDGEEAIFFKALQALSSNVLVIVVPRHPERFAEVQASAIQHEFTVAKRSDGINGPIDADVLLGDSMGEMFAYYAAADVAIIGGSFGPYGSQNLLEAMAIGCPVVVGPSRFNFDHVIAQALQSGGALGVSDIDEALEAALSIIASEEKSAQVTVNAKNFCSAHQGATDKTMAVLQPWLR